MPAPALVQSTGLAGFTNATVYPKPFASNVTGGNALIAGGFINDSSAGTGFFSDSQSNTWVTFAFTGLNGGLTTLYAGYALNATAGATTCNLTTATGASPPSFNGCISQIGEVSGVTGFDSSAGHQTNTAGSGNSFAGASLTTVQAVEMVITVFLYLAGDGLSLISSPATIWGLNNANNFGIAGYRPVSTTGTYSITATGSNTSWASIAFGLYQGGSPPPAVKNMLLLGVG